VVVVLLNQVHGYTFSYVLYGNEIGL